MIKERTKFNGAMDRVEYYTKILHDFMDEEKGAESIGKAKSKDNIRLCNDFIILNRDGSDLLIKLFIFVNLNKYIYGEHSIEFHKALNNYVGYRKTMNVVSYAKFKLKHVELPAHYIPAFDYHVKNIGNRIKYLNAYYNAVKKTTPIEEWEKINGIDITDDFREFSGYEAMTKLNTMTDEHFMAYIQHMCDSMDISEPNELKIRYQKFTAERLARIAAAEKLEKMKEEQEIADAWATKFVREMDYEISRRGSAAYMGLYNKAIDMEHAKIYVLVSRVGARGGRRPGCHFLSKTGKLTRSVNAAAIFGEHETPEALAQYVDSYQYGYAEFLFK